MIKVLSKNVSDKIAAGEVIERPISIVKELVENSIDSGADTIAVEIKNGGKTFIRVTDNGCGIPAEEVETAFLRHATSKIEAASDLETIKSLGFRGEALASIAAVTRTTLITKTADSKTGSRITIHEQVTTTQLYAKHKANVKRDLVQDMEWETERIETENGDFNDKDKSK